MKQGNRAAGLIVVVAVAGILANVAVPAAQSASVTEEVADVIQTLRDIRTATDAYAEDEGRYPAHGGWGVLPVELEATGVELDLDTRRADLRWRNWGLSGGLDRPIRAVQIRSDEAGMLQAILDQWDDEVILVRNDQITVLMH